MVVRSVEELSSPESLQIFKIICLNTLLLALLPNRYRLPLLRGLRVSKLEKLATVHIPVRPAHPPRVFPHTRESPVAVQKREGG